MIYVPFMRKDPVVLTMSAFLQKNIDLNALAIGEGVLLKTSYYSQSICSLVEYECLHSLLHK